ncbi:hypothetical protein THAOC_22618 [Thalassiosira oceanica]|uniref:Single-stranded DNA binding protein Ssb-like OB fold domain-containing protein n=1 Tax=Thalassiosira oceanica TaxID=159749 RepID=K0RXZ7_THAOC|nr:hypothetical protein THAOC_22618 [Thalassiosira oceanica]|eukprot:EJK57349.1 hypothetical protein THAOC_22618 [Thalassiosira oceanica]
MMPPLRRAKYHRVEELVSSHYDVCLTSLKDQLATLRAEQSVVGKTSFPEDLGSADATNVWSLQVLPEQRKGRPSHTPAPPKHFHTRLQPPREGSNLCLLVGDVDVVVDKLRVDGSRVLVAEVEVGDETGSVSLRARDDQIDLLRKVSHDNGAIVLRNAQIELYQGRYLRLAVSKWGKMEAYPDGIESTPDPPLTRNRSLNYSLVDLNLVATSKATAEANVPVQVATVHHKTPKGQQFYQSPHHTNYPMIDGPSDFPRSQGRPFYQRKKRDESQRRPRSGSNNSSGSHYQSSPMSQYPQYHVDAGSVYSYPSSVQQQDSQQTVPVPNQYLSSDHYSRQQQILYQQYELQQRHAHLQMLDAQRRMLHHQMTHSSQSSIVPEFSVDGSVGEDYSVSSMGGYIATPTMQPTSPQHHMSPMSPTYQYGVLPPPHHVFEEDHNPQLISPPVSPTHQPQQPENK